MGVQSIEIHQSNMYCRHCLYHVLQALSKIGGIKYFNINMETKIIKIKYQNKDWTNESVQYYINKAIETGKID